MLIPALMFLTGCGGGSAGAGSGSSTPPPTVNNVQPVQVNLGPLNNAADTLYTNVTICVPGTTDCQTIQNVTVDTGAEGFRVLSSQLALSLPQVTENSSSIGNCIVFADMSYVWGPVMRADIQMAGEKALNVPIQVIGDSSFPAVPSSCNTGGGQADDTVNSLGGNATIGIGLFRHDCGASCSGSAAQAPPVYFDCSASSCSVASVLLSDQVQNPVWLFPQDNNGILISLPSIPPGGAPTASGSMIFGIGTQSNNSLGSAEVYTTDANGNFTTQFNGNTYSSSFIDTGSNGIFFLSSSTIGLPPCSNQPGYSCPSSTVNYNATNVGSNGASGQVSFSIANADTLFSTANAAFNDLGGPDTGQFDWGLPFFFGRDLFIAINSENTPAGPGPYWAY